MGLVWWCCQHSKIILSLDLDLVSLLCTIHRKTPFTRQGKRINKRVMNLTTKTQKSPTAKSVLWSIRHNDSGPPSFIILLSENQWGLRRHPYCKQYCINRNLYYISKTWPPPPPTPPQTERQTDRLTQTHARTHTARHNVRQSELSISEILTFAFTPPKWPFCVHGAITLYPLQSSNAPSKTAKQDE